MHEHYDGFTLINMNGRLYASFSRLSVPMAVALPFDRLRVRDQGAVSAES